MKNKIIYLFIGVIFLLIVGSVYAQTTGSIKNNTSVKNLTTVDDKISVAVYIINLGKFDIATGSFTVDFYLSLKCENTCPTQDFEFMNGRASSTDKIVDKPNEKFYRIQANLNSPIDLRKFPFDSQTMEIIIEDKKLTTEFLNYEVNSLESGIDDSIAFTGWNLGEPEVIIREHYYAVYDETYSQYVFNIPINRIIINSFFKTFLPIIFIILVMLSSFVLDPDKITTRIAMVSSALVASVMFHVSLANQIPPVGYLTLVDKFMVLTYFILLMSFVLNVILLELLEKKKTELVEKIHRKTEFAMLVIVPIIYLIFFFIMM